MNQYTFELELIQLEELFSRSRSNKYSDPRKNKYFKELYETISAITSENYSSFNTTEQEEHRQIFDFLLNGLEFLDTSTLNIIPFELVFCLGKALKDWVNSDDLIIVTSLSHRKSDIWFEGFDEERLRNLKLLIKDKYSINISYRLIRISLPKSIARDYLSGVVLYHELGHFIDTELNITNRIYYNKYKKVTFTTEEEYRFYHHQMEYFADLFAAQYVNLSSDNYLSHLAYKEGDSDSHPATTKRNEVVAKFLKGETCEEIDLIQEALEKGGHEKLKIRHTIIDPDKSEFALLIPQSIKTDEELHGIYKLGWDLWLNSDKNFLEPFSRRQKYYIVNNLIEKSISNYNVVQSYKEIKTSIPNG